MERLNDLGWDEQWAAHFAPHADDQLVAGRVLVRHKGLYTVATQDEDVLARIRGVLRFEAESWAAMPTTGDWLALARPEGDDFWRIRAILPRRTCLSRKVKGSRTEEQLLAANVTTVFIVMGMTEDYNLRRLERYAILARECGARPVVILNKADLVAPAEAQAMRDECAATAGGAAVHVLSALVGGGVDAVRAHLGRGETVIIVGSSGAGKSTLVNAILGEELQLTGEVRADDGRGRHTTTTRELILLPGGASLIDSPGIREIQLWASEATVGEAFPDIEALAAECRFRDCRHDREPGCAVLAAIESGSLAEGRLRSYRQLRAELDRTSARKRDLTEGRRAFKPARQKRDR